MKYMWEPDDIKVGTLVMCSNKSETYMIGWISWAVNARYVIISTLDGMVLDEPLCKDVMSDVLNRDGYIPVTKDVYFKDLIKL